MENKKLILFIFFSVALLGGCHTKREVSVRQQEQIKEIRSAHDSLHRKIEAERFQKRKKSARVVHLSAPDSAGRQYAKTVVEIRNEVETQDREQTTESAGTVSIQTISALRKADEKIREQKGKNNLFPGIFLFPIVLTGGICAFKFLFKHLKNKV
jgi:uncharacterized membrane protein